MNARKRSHKRAQLIVSAAIVLAVLCGLWLETPLAAAAQVAASLLWIWCEEI